MKKLHRKKLRVLTKNSNKSLKQILIGINKLEIRKLKRIQRAYFTLKDPRTKLIYDRTGLSLELNSLTNDRFNVSESKRAIAK